MGYWLRLNRCGLRRSSISKKSWSRDSPTRELFLSVCPIWIGACDCNSLFLSEINGRAHANRFKKNKTTSPVRRSFSLKGDLNTSTCPCWALRWPASDMRCNRLLFFVAYICTPVVARFRCTEHHILVISLHILISTLWLSSWSQI